MKSKMRQPLPIMIRQVWKNNLVDELRLIAKCIPQFHYVAIHTEFPGLPLPSPPGLSSYGVLKHNVDPLKIIQLGLTLSDITGDLPTLDDDGGDGFRYIWQFNFHDFDLRDHDHDQDHAGHVHVLDFSPRRQDDHDPDHITLLIREGINFDHYRERGIHSRQFAIQFERVVLALQQHFTVTWIAFHGALHFGLLIKILLGQDLPEKRAQFERMVLGYLGTEVCDTMNLCWKNGVHGGLDLVAREMKVEREVGWSIQAGSNSLLAVRVFWKVVDMVRRNRAGVKWRDLDGIFGVYEL